MISRSELIDYFYYGIDDKPIIDGISDRKIIDIIKNQPTAYDIDKVVDELKNKWAHSNGYKLIRIWEHDINENPQKVMKLLRDELNIIDKKEDKKMA